MKLKFVLWNLSYKVFVFIRLKVFNRTLSCNSFATLIYDFWFIRKHSSCKKIGCYYSYIFLDSFLLYLKLCRVGRLGSVGIFFAICTSLLFWEVFVWINVSMTIKQTKVILCCDWFLETNLKAMVVFLLKNFSIWSTTCQPEMKISAKTIMARMAKKVSAWNFILILSEQFSELLHKKNTFSDWKFCWDNRTA